MTEQELKEIDERISSGKATDEDIEKMTDYLVEYMKELDLETKDG